MRDSVDGARPSFSATSSSLSECPSRRRLSSAPRRRRRTVGPRGTRNSPPHEACRGVCGQGFTEENGTGPQSGHQAVTGPLRLVPDKQYDTALTSWMKSHPGFQLGNFLHALAPRGLAPPSSVLVPVSASPPKGAN